MKLILVIITLTIMYLVVNYAKPVVLFLYEAWNAPEEIPTPDRYCKFQIKKKLERDGICYQTEFSKDGIKWYELGNSFYSKEKAVEHISKYVESGEVVYEYDPLRKQLAEHVEHNND